MIIAEEGRWRNGSHLEMQHTLNRSRNCDAGAGWLEVFSGPIFRPEQIQRLVSAQDCQNGKDDKSNGGGGGNQGVTGKHG
jgi:hypothetical protein